MALVDAIVENKVIQRVKTPTRIRSVQEPSLLDLVLTKYRDSITELQLKALQGKSDHAVLTFKCWSEFPQPVISTCSRPRFTAIDHNVLLHMAKNIDWPSLRLISAIEEQWVTFREWILTIISEIVPLEEHSQIFRKDP